MHLNYIGLQNFRVFKDFTAFDLAPITVLTGQNNSGKSSFNKAILTLMEGFVDQETIDNIYLNDIENGIDDINSFLNNKSAPKSPFVFETDISLFDFDERLRVEMEYVALKEEFTNQFALESIKVICPDGEVLLALKRSIEYYYDVPESDPSEVYSAIKYSFNKEYFINLYRKFIKHLENTSRLYKDQEITQEGKQKNLLNKNHPYFNFDKKINEECFPYISPKDAYDLYEGDVVAYMFEKDNDTYGNSMIDKFSFEQCLALVSGGVNIRDYNEWHTSLFDFNWYFINTNGIPQIFGFEQNLFSIKKSKSLIYFEEKIIGGAIDKIAKLNKNFKGISHFSVERSHKNNFYIQKIYNSFKKSYHGCDEAKSFLKWSFDLIGIPGIVKVDKTDSFTIYLETENGKELLSNFGYGYSQLIPIILKIYNIADNKFFYGNNDLIPEMIILEEPEANLHPNLQSKLADIIVKAMKDFNIQFIIETHSEYFIRKLQYLTAKKELKPEDSVIYYFNPPNMKLEKGEKQIEKLTIRKDGMMDKDFGKGFFDESTNLTLDLLKLQNMN